MHLITITSYLIASAAYLAGAALLGVSWRGQRTGALLILAMLLSVLWSAFLAYAGWQETVAVHWLMLAEVLRYGAWLVFLTALSGVWQMSRLMLGLRVATHALWIMLALYCLWPASGLQQVATHPFNPNVPLMGVLVLALTGVMFLEQIYRNVPSDKRWALKFLVISLGMLFAYDILMYSFAVLYGQFYVSAWAARGFINVLLVPPLLVAAARNPQWSLDVGVSRRVVFYSTSLMVVAFYIISTAIGGYYVRLYGGDWGRVAEIALVCFALLLMFLVVSSGQARSRLRLFLHKNFFSFRHDYREQWLRLTTTLSASETELSLRAVRAIAQTMDSPAGALFTRGETDSFELIAFWNMSVAPGLKFPAQIPAFEFMREHRWIYDLDQPPPHGAEELKAPGELSSLPHAWLLVPLVLEERLIGFVVLAQARARRKLDWEDIDLLRAAGSQVASALAQAADARQLAEAQQFEGFNRLTAFLMHDLKNIAAQQSLLLQNAKNHKDNPAFVDDMLTTVENSVQRITRLLQQLRGDAEPVAHSRVQLLVVIDKALKECSAHRPKPDFVPPVDDLWVKADAQQLAAVLVHLVRNGQDATVPDGRVSLEVRSSAKHAIIDIKDDGDGMDDDFIRNRLFQPFFTTKASKGMGIGAYQAREYVRSLGGKLGVSSNPGKGTVFTIQLPLSEPAGDAAGTGSLRVAS